MRKILAIATLVIVAGLSINVGQADAAYNVTQPGGTGNNLSVIGFSGAYWDMYSVPGHSLWGYQQVSGDPVGILIPPDGDYVIRTCDTPANPHFWGDAGCFSVLSFTMSGGDLINVVLIDISTITRIISVDPYHEETVATSTNVGAVVYVSSSDWVDGMYLSINLTNNTIANGVGGSASEAWNSAFGEIIYELEEGSNTVGGTQIFPLIGQVNALWRIKIPNSTPIIGSFLPDQVLVSSTTQFVVIQRTALDIAMASTSEVLINALITGTTSQSVLRCNPTNFDITVCIISVFLPSLSVLQSDFEQLRDGFLTKWPLGYVTRIVDILSSTTARSLPVISATLPSGVIGAGSSIVLDANHSLDYILNATTSRFTNGSASSTRTLYEITSDYWDIFVYICLGLYIVRRILGSHIIGHHKK